MNAHASNFRWAMDQFTACAIFPPEAAEAWRAVNELQADERAMHDELRSVREWLASPRNRGRAVEEREAMRARLAQLDVDDHWYSHSAEASRIKRAWPDALAGLDWMAVRERCLACDHPHRDELVRFCEYELAERGVRAGGYTA
jgi:hypothetical protein